MQREETLRYNDGDNDYNIQGHVMDSNSAVATNKKSISSKSSVSLTGPMDVDGFVKSAGAISFLGDFIVREQIEAYGDIKVSGSLNCTGRIKSLGNLDIDGYVYCGSKVKICGTLTVNGHLEVSGDIEVWGAIVLQGYMKCRTLTAHASVNTIGSSSYYEVEEPENDCSANMAHYASHEDGA